MTGSATFSIHVSVGRADELYAISVIAMTQDAVAATKVMLDHGSAEAKSASGEG